MKAWPNHGADEHQSCGVDQDALLKPGGRAELPPLECDWGVTTLNREPALERKPSQEEREPVLKREPAPEREQPEIKEKHVLQ